MSSFPLVSAIELDDAHAAIPLSVKTALGAMIKQCRHHSEPAVIAYRSLCLRFRIDGEQMFQSLKVTTGSFLGVMMNFEISGRFDI